MLVVVLIMVLMVIVVRKFIMNRDGFSNPESLREDEAMEAYYTNKNVLPGHGRDNSVAQTLCLDKKTK
jgi:hypothetical protein